MEPQHTAGKRYGMTFPHEQAEPLLTAQRREFFSNQHALITDKKIEDREQELVTFSRRTTTNNGQ